MPANLRLACLAVLLIAGCATGSPGPRTAQPATQDDVWMGDLMRDGFRIESEVPFRQTTPYGPKTFRYLLQRGDERWACYTMDSAVDREAITDRRCYPYDPA